MSLLSAACGDSTSRSPVARRFSSTVPSGQSLGADDQLPGNADQVHRGELGARAVFGIVVQHVAAGLLQCGVGFASQGKCIDGGIAGAQAEDRHVERRHAVGPDHAGVVVRGLDDGAQQTRYADAVGAHMDIDVLAVGTTETTAFIGLEYFSPK